MSAAADRFGRLIARGHILTTKWERDGSGDYHAQIGEVHFLIQKCIPGWVVFGEDQQISVHRLLADAKQSVIDGCLEAIG